MKKENNFFYLREDLACHLDNEKTLKSNKWSKDFISVP